MSNNMIDWDIDANLPMYTRDFLRLRGETASERGMRIAENVTVDERGLIIDGLRLPFFLAYEPIKVSIDPDDGTAKVNVTLITESVSINPNDIVATPEGDVIMLEPEEGL